MLHGREVERARLVALIEAAGGQTARAVALLSAARRSADDPLLLADIDRLRGRVEMNAGSAADGHRIFTQAAERVAKYDPVRALEMATAAAVARSHGADSGATLPDGVVNVDPDPRDTPRTRCLKRLLVSTRHEIAGERATALTVLREAQDVALGSGDTMRDVDLLGNLGNAALRLGDDHMHRRFYALMLSVARENGDVMGVLYALQRVAFGHYVAGRWPALRSTAEEAVALGHSVGQPARGAASLAWLTLLSALEGRTDYDQRLQTLDDLVAAHPPLGILAQPVEDLTRWARGTRAALTGDAAGALHHFRHMRLPTLTLMAAPDRIDAAVRAGDRDQALVWVAELESFSSSADVAWARAAVGFGRAVTCDPDDDSGTDALFGRSLTHHASAVRPYERARVQLAYGEFLRRHQRRVDARGHLRGALETFEDLHAVPLADRARQELRASGETARKRDPSTALNLTPMELKVAELVSQGLSNKDVAAQCWVSPRTVAFQLRNVFTKAGVTSRSELTHVPLR